MSDKNFKVKNGLTIQGTTDTLITADNAGGILVNGSPIYGPPGADGAPGAPGADGAPGAPGADGAPGALQNMVVFNESNKTPGTVYGWTVPAGVTRIKATLIGPGGSPGLISVAVCLPNTCAATSWADEDSTQSTYIVADVSATRALPGAPGVLFTTSSSESLSVGAYNTSGGGGGGSSAGQPERYTSTRPGAGAGAVQITLSLITSTSFSQQEGTPNRISFDWSRNLSQTYRGFPGQDGEEKVVYLDVVPGTTINYRVGAPYEYNSGRPGQVMIEY